MKKIKLLIAAVAVLSLVSSSAVYAEGFAPGEGLYVGAFLGHAGGHVSAKVVADAGSGETGDTTVDIKDGGIGLEGIEGGGFFGYGYKMDKLYIGFEGDFAGGGPKFNITTDRSVTVQQSANNTNLETLDKVDVEAQWTGGAGGRIGYYANPNTLLTFKAGIAASKFDVVVGSDSESFYGGGPRLGASIESALVDVDPNLSVRLQWDYTDYLTAPVSGVGATSESAGLNNSEVSGAAYSARFGIQYSFFDANSLF
jgi:hypothetical protein